MLFLHIICIFINTKSAIVYITSCHDLDRRQRRLPRSQPPEGASDGEKVSAGDGHERQEHTEMLQGSQWRRTSR